MATVVLFDDERSFVPGFRDDAVVLRTVEDAEEFFSNAEVIDELWLDFVLRPGDTTDAIHALAGVEVKKIYFHSSAWAAKGLVELNLARVGVTTPVEFPEDPRVLKVDR